MSRIDRRSLVLQLGLVGLAVLLFLIPSGPGLARKPRPALLRVLTVPVCVALLVLYASRRWFGLRRHRRRHGGRDDRRRSSLELRTGARRPRGRHGRDRGRSRGPRALAQDAFAETAGLSQFFIAAVIVAIVGNAAEHGGAVVIAAPRQDQARHRDRDLVERAGRPVRDSGDRVDLVGWSARRCRCRSGRSSWPRWAGRRSSSGSSSRTGSRGATGGFPSSWPCTCSLVAGFWVAGDR